MCSLEVFPPPPTPGYITVCEQRGELVIIPEEERDNIAQDGIPEEMTVTVKTLRSRLVKDCAKSAFLEHNDTFKKVLTHAWYEHGMTGVLAEISVDQDHVAHWMSNFAGKLLTTWNWFTSLCNTFSSNCSMSSCDLIADYSPNANWHGAIVRCFSWHPHVSKFAIALSDDTVHVHTCDRQDNLPILKHKQQKQVACMAWKPQSGTILALACESCILIWQVDPTSLATSSVQVLQSVKHRPVISLAWDPLEQLLASTSPLQNDIIIWDVSSESQVALRRAEGSGISMIQWAPQGNKLFCAYTNTMFRVWETHNWSCEVWKHLSSRCQTGCWSPDGSILLFCTNEEPIIYNLLFNIHEDSALIGGSKSATVSADLSPIDIETSNESVRIGGRIQHMTWDPTGERLAVLFKDNCNKYITIFQTRLKPTFEMIPCGFIQGCLNDIPTLINFQPGFKGGALLSVVWNTGRISHIPMYFITRNIVQEKGIPNIQSNPLLTKHKCYSTTK